MIFHPCIPEIAKRYTSIDAGIEAGRITLPEAIYKYAWVVKDNALGIATLKSAVPEEANEGELSMPFVISTQDPDRDGDVVISRGCQLSDYAPNRTV